MLDPPPVTIVDPSRPEPSHVDELGDDGPASRRGLSALVVVVVVVVLIVGWRGVDTVVDRRAAAAEERRLQGVVALELTARSSGGRESRDTADVATVERPVGLRNTGPRPVEVLSASFGSLVFEGSRGLEPGRALTLPLGRTLSCVQRPADEPVQETVRVSVRAADGGVVEQRLPLPPDIFLVDPALLRRACGYLDPYEAGTSFPSGVVRLDNGALLVDLAVGNAGRAPLNLARLGGGSGMSVSLHAVSGQPADLPFEVPPGVGSGELPALAVTVRLQVEDCTAVVPPGPADELADLDSAATLATSFAAPGVQPDADQQTFFPLEQSAVVDLLELSCP